MTWTYFTRDEFDCPCGCGHNIIADDFVTALDSARDEAGIPFTIISGCRCPTHNATVSTVGDSSPHLGGRAADIYAPSSRERFLILTALMLEGFTRFGIGPDFIHVDDQGDADPDVIWLY